MENKNFHFVKMDYRESVTNKQHDIDSHLFKVQTFVDNFNNDDETSDVYRQQMINQLNALDDSLLNSYKQFMNLKATNDFGHEPNHGQPKNQNSNCGPQRPIDPKF